MLKHLRPSHASLKHFARSSDVTLCSDDPIFFDPDADEPVPLNPQEYEQDMIETMAQAGINPAFIYAFKRTGRIVTESNRDRLTEEELRQWNDAIDEYQHKVDSGKVV